MLVLRAGVETGFLLKKTAFLQPAKLYSDQKTRTQKAFAIIYICNSRRKIND
jgi:hypothetical protein